MATDPTSLDALAAQRARQRRGLLAPDTAPALGTSMVPALDSNPDEVAAARARARRSGLPLPLAEQEPQRAEREARLRELDLPTLAQRSPATARTLEDPEIARVAHDDVENMSFIERYTKDIGQRFERGARVNELGGLGFDAIIGNDDPAREFRIRQLTAQDANEVDYDVDMGGGAAGFLLGIPGAAAEALPMMGESIKASVKGGLAGGATGAAVGAGLGLAGGPAAPATVPAGALTGATTGYGYGSAIGLYLSSAKMEAGHSYLDLRGMTDENGQPIDPRVAKGISLSVGAVAGGLEMWGLSKLFAKIPGAKQLTGAGIRGAAKQALADPAFRKFATQLVGTMTESAITEGLTEGAQELVAIGGELAAGATQGKGIDDFTFQTQGPDGQPIVLRGTQAILARVLSATSQGAQMGAGMAGAGRVARVMTDSERARAALAKVPGIERLTKATSESKLRERDPEAFRKLVKQVADEAQVDSVYIEPEAMRTYFEHIAPEEAAALAADIPDLSRQQEEVARTGGDVKLKLEDWLAHPELAEALGEHARFDPLDMTQKEALGWQEDLQREVGSLQELSAGAKGEQDALRLVANHVRSELLKVYPETVVGPMVEFTVDRVRARAERKGVGVAALIEDEGLFRAEGPNGPTETQGQLPPSLEEKLGSLRDETRIREVVRDLREGRTPEQKGMSTRPLLEALRDLGGVDPEGDLGVTLRELGIKASGKGSMKGLIVKGGMGAADNLVAEETPAFAELVDRATGYVDPRMLERALGEEIAGKPIRTREEGQVIAEAEAERQTIRDALEAAGLDLNADDEAIVEAVRKATGGLEYEQPAYHGTPHRFSEFDITKIGTGEGAQAYGWGLYFSSSRGIANFYRANLAGEGRASFRGIIPKSGWTTEQRNDAIAKLADKLKSNRVTAENALRALEVVNSNLDDDIETAIAAAKKALKDTIDNPGEGLIWDGVVEHARGELAFLNSDLASEITKKQKGQLVEVEIPDDENLLDWNKPLVDQPEPVIEKITSMGLDDVHPALRAFALKAIDRVVVPLQRDFQSDEINRIANKFQDAANRAIDHDSAADMERAFRQLDKEINDASEEALDALQDALWDLSDQIQGISSGDMVSGLTGEQIYGNLTATLGSPEAASKALLAAGITGHRYEAGQIAGVKGDATNFVIYDDKAIKVARTFYEGHRGAIRMTDDLAEVVIRFTEAADLSTFIHESAHLFLAQLEKDAATDEGQLDADLATVKDWAREKVGSDDLKSEAVQELWARSFEAYVMEGKAPSLSLERVFARMQAWLVRIYKRLRGIPGYAEHLTPEIRGVMDRLLATDQQIAEAAEARGLAELDAQALGMTDAQAEKYKAQVADGMAEAKRLLQVQLMAQLERQKTREWAALREGVRKEVEADVNARPVFQAAQWLAKGAPLEGQPTPDLPVAKLDAGDLVALYGKEIKKALPRKFWAKDGLHPDLVAEAFGFLSGDDLVRSLEAAGDRRAVIEQETDALMEKRHGTLQTSAQIEDAAVEALANAKQIRALQTAERAIAAKAGGKVIPMDVTRATAQRIVRSSRYRDLTPARYRAAALKASREVVKMIAQGKFPEAQIAIRHQIMNLVMEAEARKAMTEADRGVDYLNRVQNRKSWERIGKAGADYQEQIEGLLARFDLRQHQSLRKIDKLKGLAAWIAEQEAQGEDVIIPPKLRDEAFKTSWKELSIEDLLALRDSVKNLEHLARRKNEFMANRDRRQREAVQADLVQAIAANLPGRKVPNDETPDAIEMVRRRLLSTEGSFLKVEFLIDQLDGGNPLGPWRANVFTPIAEAQAERYDLSREYTERFAKLMSELVKGRESEFRRKWLAPQTGNRLSMWNVLGVALNVGNEGNYRNLVEGNGLSEGAIKSLLDEHMTERDWTFVRETWKLIDSLWPRIAEQERRLTGVVPEKVTGRTVSTPFGEFEGGYFPIVRDPSPRGGKAAKAFVRRSASKGLYEGLENGFQRAITGHGHTIERTGATGALLLDVAAIPSHLDQVIHDLTHRDVLMQVDKLLQGESIANGFAEAGRDEWFKLFRPWLQGIATDRIVENRNLAGMAWALRWVRANTTSFTLGLRATTLLMQVSGHSNAMGMLRKRLPNAGRWMATGMRKAFAGGRMEAMRANYHEVLEASGEMRHRIANLDRDLRDVVRRNQSGVSVPARVKTAAMELIGQVQMFAVDLPVWNGAYEGAVRELGYTHEQAVTFADSIIRMSQGAAGAKDLSAIQRADEGYKQFLTFFTYRNLVYNQVMAEARRVKAPRDVGRFLAAWAFAITIPYVYSSMVRQAFGSDAMPMGDDDDPADWIQWLMAGNFSEFVGTVPFMSELAGIARIATGEGRYFVQETPTQRAGEALADLAVPKDETEFMFDALRVGAMATGLPADWALKEAEDAIRESD